MQNPYDLIGTTLSGKYYIKELIGAGGMGLVYRASFVETDDLAAVKVIQPVKLRPERIERAHRLFNREAKSLQSLSHPNIVSIYDYGFDGDNVFIAMEWLEGQDLAEELSKGQLSLDPQLLFSIKYAKP